VRLLHRMEEEEVVVVVVVVEYAISHQSRHLLHPHKTSSGSPDRSVTTPMANDKLGR